MPDPAVLAFNIARQLTSEPFASPAESEPQKNPHAVAMGRLGGLKGGKARAAKLTKKQRSEIAKRAVAARWMKTRNGNQEST